MHKLVGMCYDNAVYLLTDVSISFCLFVHLLDFVWLDYDLSHLQLFSPAVMRRLGRNQGERKCLLYDHWE